MGEVRYDFTPDPEDYQEPGSVTEGPEFDALMQKPGVAAAYQQMQTMPPGSRMTVPPPAAEGGVHYDFTPDPEDYGEDFAGVSGGASTTAPGGTTAALQRPIRIGPMGDPIVEPTFTPPGTTPLQALKIPQELVEPRQQTPMGGLGELGLLGAAATTFPQDPRAAGGMLKAAMGGGAPAPAAEGMQAYEEPSWYAPFTHPSEYARWLGRFYNDVVGIGELPVVAGEQAVKHVGADIGSMAGLVPREEAQATRRETAELARSMVPGEATLRPMAEAFTETGSPMAAGGALLKQAGEMPGAVLMDILMAKGTKAGAKEAFRKADVKREIRDYEFKLKDIAEKEAKAKAAEGQSVSTGPFEVPPEPTKPGRIRIKKPEDVTAEKLDQPMTKEERGRIVREKVLGEEPAELPDTMRDLGDWQRNQEARIDAKTDMSMAEKGRAKRAVNAQVQARIKELADKHGGELPPREEEAVAPEEASPAERALELALEEDRAKRPPLPREGEEVAAPAARSLADLTEIGSMQGAKGTTIRYFNTRTDLVDPATGKVKHSSKGGTQDITVSENTLRRLGYEVPGEKPAAPPAAHPEAPVARSKAREPVPAAEAAPGAAAPLAAPQALPEGTRVRHRKTGKEYLVGKTHGKQIEVRTPEGEPAGRFGRDFLEKVAAEGEPGAPTPVPPGAVRPTPSAATPKKGKIRIKRGTLEEFVAEAKGRAGKKAAAEGPTPATQPAPPSGPPATAAGKIKLERKYGAKNKLVTKEEHASAVKDLNKKLSTTKSNVDVTAMKEVIKIGVFHAEALSRAAAHGVADFRDWAARVRRDVSAIGAHPRYQQPLTLRRQQLRKLWNNLDVSRARVKQAETAEPAPRPHGKLERFMREAGASRGARSIGQVAFDEMRMTENRIQLAKKAIHQDTKQWFKGFSELDKQAFLEVAEGMPDSNTFGALARADTMTPAELAQKGLQRGDTLPDGRIVGEAVPEGRGEIQLWRDIPEAQARKAYADLKSHRPKVAEVLDRYMASSEPVKHTAMGTQIPPRARLPLKKRYGVETTMETEAGAVHKQSVQMAQERRGEVTSERTSYVPEATEKAGPVRHALRPLTNKLRGTRARARHRKTGATRERRLASPGGDLVVQDIAKASEKNRYELMREEEHNSMVSRLMTLLAEPIRAGETVASMRGENYTPISKTGMWAESKALTRYFARHAQWLESQGISVPDAMTAAHIAGGKGYKVPNQLIEVLAPIFGEQRGGAKSVNKSYQERIDTAHKLADSLITTINTFRLTRPSTAVRNALSNNIVYGTKALRDLYRGALQLIPGQKFQELRFQDFLSDLQAPFRVLGKEARTRIPAERLGATFVGEGLESGTMSKAAGVMLAPFQAVDVHTKRTIYEAVVDANAKQTWAAAKRLGQTQGLTRAEWIKKYKADVPPAIESLIHREMDTWGGYDYDNIPQKLRNLKSSTIGRAVIPYPTYYYKLLMTYREMLGPKTWRDAFSKDRGKRINAISNIMAGVTSLGLADMAVQALAPDDLPEDIRDRDLPAGVQTFGRLRAGKAKSEDPEDAEGRWVRLYDMPVIGEVMAARGLAGGDLNLGEYLNDRVALGPAFNTVAIMAGLTNRFNQHMTMGGRLGREVASWSPFQAEAQFVRRMIDPAKRNVTDKDEPGLLNFARGFADQYPGLSFMSPDRVDGEMLSAPRYRRMETLMSHFLMNMHFVSEKERTAAIGLAKLEGMRSERTELKRERVNEYVKDNHDAFGQTPAGKIKLERLQGPKALASDQAAAYAALETDRAFFQAAKKGGSKAALEAGIKALEKAIEGTPKEYQGDAAQAGVRALRLNFRNEELGFTRQEWLKADADVRERFKEVMEED